MLPDPESCSVRDAGIVIREPGTETILQDGDRGLIFAHELAVGPITDTIAVTLIPDESIFVIRDLAFPLSSVGTTPSAITARPCFLKIIVSIGAHTPVMSVGTDFRIHVEIIQQHETLCQRMLVWGDIPAKEQQRSISPSAGHIRQHLIIGPVLLDDIEDILDRRGLTRPHRNRETRGRGISQFRLPQRVRRVGIYLTGIGSQLRFIRRWDDAHRPLEQTSDVFHLTRVLRGETVMDDLLALTDR